MWIWWLDEEFIWAVKGMRSYSVHLYIVTVATMQDKENDWYAI